ncbi:TetR/AcrR family transcriptional regulator [Chloroflexi bacterium TSY]|nr:TetR/AcrR family transcriptional regulator [Chloroflexi bacterium TSY]
MAGSENEERKQRILDAAAELFIHYGYDKTTVSDVARAAGVSKGAIYLHFKSKDELFEGLLMRETMTYQKRWLELIDADPKGGTIGGMYKSILYAMESSPLISAMFRQDGRVLGSYLRKPGTLFSRRNQSIRYEFVKMMQDVGAVRKDVDPKVTAHIMDMLAYGLVSVGEVKDPEKIPPTADIIEGIADIMDRALTPEDGGNSEAGKVILRRFAESARQQFES